MTPSWLMTLVRSIVLAEPMVADFGGCFAGITDGDTVLALADSFRLDHCVVRDRLAAIASAAARQPAAGLRWDGHEGRAAD